MFQFTSLPNNFETNEDTHLKLGTLGSCSRYCKPAALKLQTILFSKFRPLKTPEQQISVKKMRFGDRYHAVGGCFFSIFNQLPKSLHYTHLVVQFYISALLLMNIFVLMFLFYFIIIGSSASSEPLNFCHLTFSALGKGCNSLERGVDEGYKIPYSLWQFL